MINTISFIKLTNYCYRLKIPFDDIYTSVFLLTTEKGNVFVDCGTIPTDVTEYILPSLSLLGISAESVKGLFLTHSHSDHAGGLETFLENMPNITVFSFNREICNKYTNSHLLVDEECILEHLICYSLPGHSNDASGILDLRTEALITGDSIQLWGIGKYGCGVGDAAAYVKSLAKLAENPPKQLYTSHAYFPLGDCAISKNEVMNYLIESKNAFEEIIKWTWDLFKVGQTDPIKISERINKYMQQTMPNPPIIPVCTIVSILNEVSKPNH